MATISKAKLAQLDSLFAKSGRIALIAHQHPDGDALGSTSALALFLRSCGEAGLSAEPLPREASSASSAAGTTEEPGSPVLPGSHVLSGGSVYSGSSVLPGSPIYSARSVFSGSCVYSGSPVSPSRSALPQVSVVLPDPYPASIGFITGEIVPIIASEQPAEAQRVLEEADLLVYLDFNSPERTDCLADVLSSLDTPKVLIDHHLGADPSRFAVCFSQTEVSSTCELLYQILKRLCALGKAAARKAAASELAEGAPALPLPKGAPAASEYPASELAESAPALGESSLSQGAPALLSGAAASELPESTVGAPESASDVPTEQPGASVSAPAALVKPRKLTRPIAEALLAGMTTDTNNFANSVYPSTLRMASDLLALGADRDLLLQRLYQSARKQRVRLLGHYLQDLLHISPDGIAYAVLDSETARRFNLQDGETEGFVNQPLAIESVRASIFLREDGEQMRVSIRSKPGFSAAQLSRRFFHGGGHELAAGGRLRIPDDISSSSEAIPYIENAVARFVQKPTDDE